MQARGGSALGQAGIWGGALRHLNVLLCWGAASAKLGVVPVLFTSEGPDLGVFQ